MGSRARMACGMDGSCSFHLTAALPLASSRETTQSSFAALVNWAAAVSPSISKGRSTVR